MTNNMNNFKITKITMTLCAIGVCILDIRVETTAADKVPRITNYCK